MVYKEKWRVKNGKSIIHTPFIMLFVLNINAINCLMIFIPANTGLNN